MAPHFRAPFPVLRTLLVAAALLCSFLGSSPSIQASSGASIELAWDPSTDSDVAGYKIYYGSVSGVYTSVLDAGNASTCTVTGLGPGTTYFVCTAYTASGLESLPSAEISYTSTPDSQNQPPTLNQPPTVTVAGGASVSASPASIILVAAASDPDGAISKVEFYSGSTKLSESTSAPFSFAWNGVPAGSYSFTAVATDSAGATTSSTPVTVVLDAPPSLANSLQFDPNNASELIIAGLPGQVLPITYSTDMKARTTLGFD